jgi:hypothetical protein
VKRRAQFLAQSRCAIDGTYQARERAESCSIVHRIGFGGVARASRERILPMHGCAGEEEWIY